MKCLNAAHHANVRAQEVDVWEELTANDNLRNLNVVLVQSRNLSE